MGKLRAAYKPKMGRKRATRKVVESDYFFPVDLDTGIAASSFRRDQIRMGITT
jgi:hypothetical protein